MASGNSDTTISSSSQNNPSPPDPESSSPSSMSFTPTTLQTIPVVEEKISVSKQSIPSTLVIEKKWVTKTELVRVPVTYEEVYVNGKPISSSGTGKGILYELRKALSGSRDSTNESKDTELQGDFVPISGTDMQQVIPLYGEQITITKKMAKLNELVIKKRRIVENKKIKVTFTKESIKLKHTDGKIEELST
ncbi:MAG: YsnF/AvaK domain-containing protein [Thermoproteota archaeon]|nr:YsnF/AvaK domain-containing protein [Thermoproteota archaeon]